LYREPSRFPLLPKELQCALTYEYHDERVGGQTAQAARITPLVEFNTQLPRFAAELYQIYRHARIMAIDFTMDIVNTSSTTTLIAAVGCLPLANCNSITDPKTIISVPGSIRKQIGLSTGTSRATIRKRFVTCRELGELTIGSNTYLQTYSEALSSAVWTELPAIYSGVIASNTGGNWTGIIDYRLTFHIRWSEYSIPALGLGELTPPDMSESEEPPVRVPSPALVRTKQRSALSGNSVAFHKR